jgi:protein-S-isoprenylcysteine O-methyltransferase Ste14
MYLGMVLTLTGLGVCLGSLTPWVVIPVFVSLITVRFIRREEASLTEQFGEEFIDYKRHVRRWI